jgi:hypothetical protein
MNITKIPVTLSKSALSHLTYAMFGQLSNRITCPTDTEMKGKIALIIDKVDRLQRSILDVPKIDALV